MRECPTCHQQTPEGNFCVRCGAPLERSLSHARDRVQFAAAPGERRYAPWLASTLFPHLPRHSERHFHLALATGTIVVVVLGVLGLFPIALIVAAALLPLLTALYFYDVDVYEDEPGWALTWTLGWGAVTGVGTALLAAALGPSGSELIDRGSSAHVLVGGVLIPALSVAAMVAGPLVLLPYRRFNETLDGASFGAATAAMFAAAQAIVVGSDVLAGGLHPAGAAAPWVARLVAIAIATPVLAMSAVGNATAAVWLRYRSPVADRTALGPLGRPPVAIALALALVIAGAIGETFMAAGTWLAWLVLLDVVGLLLLRRALHLGLLEESAEIEIGPERRCPNCGHETATHTFCGNCGIALKALPKAARRPEGRLAATARLAHPRLLAAAAGLAGVAAVALVVVLLVAPAPAKPPCKPHQPCGTPPVLRTARAVFPGYTAWQSTALGYSLRFVSSNWHVGTQGPQDLTLQSGDGLSTISFDAVPAAHGTPRQLIDERVASLRDQLLGLVHDTNRGDRILGAAVGLRAGSGDVYQATTSTPQGPGTPVAIAIMSATDGRATIVVTVTAPGNDSDRRATVYGDADDIINSVQWRR